MRAIKVRCGKVMERFGFLLLPAGHILLLGPIAAWIIRGGRGMDLLWGAAVLCLMVLADGCLFRLLIYQRKKERLLEQILDYQHMEQLNRTRELVARERRREADALRIQLKDELKQVRELIRKSGKEAESDRESVSGRVGETLDGFLRTARQKDGAEFCGNALVSTVLEEKLRACETFQIRLEAKVYVPAGIAIRNYYLCSVFSNLLDNAIEYTPSGGTVFLKGSMSEKSWQITVFDQGPGFTKEALAHGTKRLWRGDTGRRLDGHRGLGLWIAAQVIKNHSGELELNNWKRGGMVTVRMP